MLLLPIDGKRITANDDYDRIRVSSMHGLNQSLLGMRQRNVGAIDCFFSINKWAIADENNRSICGFRRFHGLLHSVLHHFNIKSGKHGLLFSRHNQAFTLVLDDRPAFPGLHHKRIFLAFSEAECLFNEPAPSLFRRCRKTSALLVFALGDEFSAAQRSQRKIVPAPVRAFENFRLVRILNIGSQFSAV
ncbi:hypothetical protein D3C77_266830 [compost metagenome]